MTEEESIILYDVGNSFWKELGIIVNKHLAKIPVHLHDHALMIMQEKCSVYGVELEKAPNWVEK